MRAYLPTFLIMRDTEIRPGFGDGGVRTHTPSNSRARVPIVRLVMHVCVPAADLAEWRAMSRRLQHPSSPGGSDEIIAPELLAPVDAYVNSDEPWCFFYCG